MALELVLVTLKQAMQLALALVPFAAEPVLPRNPVAADLPGILSGCVSCGFLEAVVLVSGGVSSGVLEAV